jgi:hypothetical protein
MEAIMQMISLVLLKGLLHRGPISLPMWRDGWFLLSNRYGGSYQQQVGL